ncbi:aminotransferase yhxA [Paenibacillus aurantiacus]|uniref:Aminotransferase yhxA n=1 Tax=Paenibacillus aurantiacus TaxID=1936118 RepID=A0ABV5KRS5_9BACL
MMSSKISLTQKVMLGISGAALAATTAGCSSTGYAKPPKPNDSSCLDWDYDASEGVYECDDSSSSHHGSYYYNGKYYKTKNSLKSNSDYQSYHAQYIKSKSSSGFGSGSSSSGG